MTIKDKFNDLKSVVVGSTTKKIDSKLDLAVQGISSYKSQSGRNGYIDLVKSVISKSSGLDTANLGGFGGGGGGGQNISPASLGQGSRLQRYKAYDSIISNINYCNRALNVIRDNILSPDDITKISLNINPIAFLEDQNITSTEIGHVKQIITSLKLEKYLSMILYNTLLYGDFFCEIANNKTALTSRSILSENIQNLPKGLSSEIFQLITEQTKKEKYEVMMDYSDLYEDDLQADKDKKEKDVNDISLLYHEPKRVVRLQSSTIPICFGYLVFPYPEIMSPYGNVEEDMINTLCISILQNIEKKVPDMKIDGIKDTEEIKDILKHMMGSNNLHKALKVRYVSPTKMVHFKVPTTKFFPYGESIFDSTQFSSKVLIALETALTIQRLSRSTEKRKVSVEIGLPRDAKKVIEELKQTFKARKITLDSFGTVDTIPCFALSTGIKLTNGKSIELGDMIKYFNEGSKFEVYAYDHETGKVRPDKVVNAEVTGENAEVVEITFDNNKSEICTPEHLWMSRDGNYVRAKDLKPGDSLLLSDVKVKEVTFLKKRIVVGDIQTEKFHNFGLASGVFVHNSQISTFEDIFIPTKDGKSFVDINTMTEGNVDIRSKVDELKYVRDSIIAGLQVPPSFIGLEENLSNKAALSEENILFARTIIGYQKYFSEQIDELIEKVYDIIEPEKALTLLDNISINLPAPKSLQYEREARYLGELATLVETLERIGIPREYSKQKYLSSIDWEEVKKYQVEADLSKGINTDGSEEGAGGMGGMGGGMY